MVSKVRSFGILGISAYPVEIEADITHGLPQITVVGLPDNVVKESRERIRSAIKNSGFKYPASRITVNLAPADIKKEGSSLDLPIALAILAASDQLDSNSLPGFTFIGELSLDGKLKPVNGILPIAMKLAKTGQPNLLLPSINAAEAAFVDDVNAYPCLDLKQAVNFLNDSSLIKAKRIERSSVLALEQQHLLDFSEVKGQYEAKRGLEIAVAGSHNCLLIGPPGSGKTMLARRIPGIMSDMTNEEILEVSVIHSVSGLLLKKGMLSQRPFRSPHHTSSSSALVGGGSMPRPGEITLAHNGVLFMDELPEFHRDVLEALRQPLEDGEVSIARAQQTLSFPCKFMLIAAMNPCPCGYFADSKRQCHCTGPQIAKYLSKISGPLLDRIDIHLSVPSVNYEHLSNTVPAESSEIIKKRVDRSRKIQLQRFQGEKIYSNSQMRPKHVKKYCQMQEKAKELLKTAIEQLGFSARSYDKILKVSRTIADLEGSPDILSQHVSEAIQYRSLDRDLWQ